YSLGDTERDGISQSLLTHWQAAWGRKKCALTFPQDRKKKETETSPSPNDKTAPYSPFHRFSLCGHQVFSLGVGLSASGRLHILASFFRLNRTTQEKRRRR